MQTKKKKRKSRTRGASVFFFGNFLAVMIIFLEFRKNSKQLLKFWKIWPNFQNNKIEEKKKEKTNPAWGKQYVGPLGIT